MDIKTLKNVIDLGHQCRLNHSIDNPYMVTLTIIGANSKTTLEFKFSWVNATNTPGFEWNSNNLTYKILSDAVDALPDNAEPFFVVDGQSFKAHNIVVLMLVGEWDQKGRGRSKEIKKVSKRFLIDINPAVKEQVLLAA